VLEACKNDTCVCWKHGRMRLCVLEAGTNEACVIVNLTLSCLQNWIAKGGLIETKGFGL
jgi:hypothetical protein